MDVTIEGNEVTVKGPKGTLSRTISAPLSVTRQDDGSILVTRPDDERRSRSLHGLSRTLIHNMVVGVTEGYSKRLEIVGTGYRAVQKGTGIELFLGFSHTVVVEAPEGITLKVDGNLKIEVSGIFCYIFTSKLKLVCLFIIPQTILKCKQSSYSSVGSRTSKIGRASCRERV